MNINIKEIFVNAEMRRIFVNSYLMVTTEGVFVNLVEI